jgi:hypothetical protein
LTRIASIFCIVLSVASFAWGYRLAGYADVVTWIIVFGAAWLTAEWLKLRWFASAAVLAAMGLAAFGVWFEFRGGWMFNGAVFALFAWNLSGFERRLKLLTVSDRADLAGRSRRHLLRIGFLLVLGFAFEALFLLWRGQFSAQWAGFVLGVLLLGCLLALTWRKR